MNENIVELLSALESTYKNKILEGILENGEYFEETYLNESFQEFKDSTLKLLNKLKPVAMRNEMFEVYDELVELLTNK